MTTNREATADSRGLGDRILWNHGRKVVDEIVVHDCMVHLEELDNKLWYLAIYPMGSTERVMLNIYGSIDVIEEIPWDQDQEHGPRGGDGG